MQNATADSSQDFKIMISDKGNSFRDPEYDGTELVKRPIFFPKERKIMALASSRFINVDVMSQQIEANTQDEEKVQEAQA